jgi:hypothetical protein
MPEWKTADTVDEIRGLLVPPVPSAE